MKSEAAGNSSAVVTIAGIMALPNYDYLLYGRSTLPLVDLLDLAEVAPLDEGEPSGGRDSDECSTPNRFPSSRCREL